jgi:hypothetical protein
MLASVPDVRCPIRHCVISAVNIRLKSQLVGSDAGLDFIAETPA